MSELVEEARRLVDVAEKLLRETARLRGDVRAIGSRFVGWDPASISAEDLAAIRKPIRTFRGIFELLQVSRDQIVDAEQHLNAIRGKLDVISNDVISREEMKRFLIDPAPRQKPGQ